jgi:hypothetical protein
VTAKANNHLNKVKPSFLSISQEFTEAIIQLTKSVRVVDLRSEVLTAASIIAVFWDVIFRFVEGHYRTGGMRSLHLQGRRKDTE